MKKLVLSLFAAFACVSAVNAEGTAQSVNTMQVVVPQVLSVTAVPSYQAVYLTADDLNGSKPLENMVYNIKSNATYNVKTEYASTIAFTNAPGAAEQTASHTAFRNAVKFARSTDNLWYDLGQLEVLSPFNENNNVHTVFAGKEYTYMAKVDNLGFNAAPGVYTITLTVTATQP